MAGTPGGAKGILQSIQLIPECPLGAAEGMRARDAGQEGRGQNGQKQSSAPRPLFVCKEAREQFVMEINLKF